MLGATVSGWIANDLTGTKVFSEAIFPELSAIPRIERRLLTHVSCVVCRQHLIDGGICPDFKRVSTKAYIGSLEPGHWGAH